MKFNGKQKTRTTGALRENLLKKLMTIDVKPIVPITPSALRCLNAPELMKALSIIRNPPERLAPGIDRPECPITSANYQCMPTFEHKQNMLAYLERYGLHIRYPGNCVVSALEWLANAFEQARNGKEY